MRGLQARKFAGAKYLRFRCTDCGNCCTDTIVPVTHLDVRRLAQFSGLAPRDIAAFYKASEFADEGRDLYFIELEQGPRAMALRKRWSEEEGREACRFYGEKRCLAYEARPSTCRLWPFSLRLDAQGRLRRLGVHREPSCPFELDGHNEAARIEATWRLDQREEAAWAGLVARWNRAHAGGTESTFFHFIH